MRVSNFLVSADRTLDYIPVISTVTNGVDLFQKYAVLPRIQKETVCNSPYYTHLSLKSFSRCAILLIPGVGNILVGIYDFSHRKYDDQAFMLAAVQQNGEMLKHASSRLRDDEDVVLAAVKNQGSAIKYASPRLRNNRDVVLAACINSWSGWTFKDAVEQLKDDKEVVLAVLRGECAIDFPYASNRLKNDREVVLAAVRAYWWQLQSASEERRNDKEIVLVAVRAEGQALEFASEERKNDLEIVLAAVRQNGSALKFASGRLKDTEFAVLTAIRQSGYALAHASERLKNDPEVVLAAVRQNGSALEYASEERKNDFQMVMTAAKNGIWLGSIGEQLRNDARFVYFFLDNVRKKEFQIRYPTMHDLVLPNNIHISPDNSSISIVIPSRFSDGMVWVWPTRGPLPKVRGLEIRYA